MLSNLYAMNNMINHLHRPIHRMIEYVLCISFLTVPAKTQTPNDTLHLTLFECIKMGQENGPLATMARYAYENKGHRYKSFSAGFLPQLSLSGNAPQFIRTINSITQPDGSSTFLLQRQAESSAALSLSQKIPWTGTEFSIYSGINRLDNLETKGSFYRSTPLSISIRQPLFSINTMAWDLESEQLTYQSSHREFVEAMEDAAIDITNKFFSFYMASMNLRNAQLNLEANDTLFQISKGRFNVGKIAENDLLQSELAFLNAKTQFENAQLEYERVLQTLKFSLGVSDLASITVIPTETTKDISITVDDALQKALDNRSDIIDYQLQKLSAERNVRQAESNSSFSMLLSANIGLNQKANTFDQAYLNLLDQQQFSVSVEIPLINWGAGSQSVEAAKAELSRIEASIVSQNFSMQQEVKYQVQRFKQLQFQVAVAAKADTVARRRYEVARERYVIGKIDVPNLFLAQSEKDATYRSRIQTLWDYWITYYRIRRLTLYDFSTNHIILTFEKE